MIDRQLKQQDRNKSWQREMKILLLGAGESGKSTFLKQMRIIHGEDYSDQDRLDFRPLIYHNLLKGMKVLSEARKRLQTPLSNPENVSNTDMILSGYHNSQQLSPEEFVKYVEPLRSLWNDEGIQATLLRSNEFQLADSVPYFFQRLDAVGAIDYLPSRDDVLRSRKATRGVYEYTVAIRNQQFRFVDVGGQRSQRQKWFQCFDEVTAILFLVGSSEFDQKLLEDRVTNRLVESVNIFETIVNNRCFKQVIIIVFFNKSDLLEEKILKSDIRNHFPNFEGDPKKLEHVQGFMAAMFDAVRRNTQQEFYHYFTTAINTKNIKVVFNIVKDSILSKHINEIMQI